MIFELLKRAIEQKNVFMPEDMIRLQIEFFYVAGKITDDERTELLAMFPQGQQNPEEGAV